MAAFKRIRYGTALKPFTVQRVCAQFPSRSKFPLFDPTTSEDRPFVGINSQGPRCEIAPSSITGYPSISTIIGATDNLDALYRWQLRTIHALGVDGFNTFMINRMGSGRVFHSVVESLLEELVAKGEIKSTAEEALMRHKSGEQFAGELTGYLTGIRDYLRELKVNPLIRLESKTYHPILCYNGRFDAIVEVDGELTLVDWKTVNKTSEKSNSTTEKLTSDLYSNPIQIAAYVAAVNSDPAYKSFPTIKRAAIVLAYEDGRGVEVVSMNEDDIEQYFDQLCQRLNKFWWTIENSEERAGSIHFVYNPMLIKKAEEPIEEKTSAAA